MTERERYEALVREAAPRLLGYVGRRVGRHDDAADVVADVLLVAWRRADAIPRENDAAVRWLFGVARRTLANHRRGAVRRTALAARLAAELARSPQHDPDPLAATVREALDLLAPDDRELVTLTAWEGLTTAEAAEVVGVRPATARKRLERARRKLARELERRGVRAAGASAEALAPA